MNTPPPISSSEDTWTLTSVPDLRVLQLKSCSIQDLKSTNDCRQVARDAIEAVTTAVQAQQSAVDALRGDQCFAKHKQIVKKAQAREDAARLVLEAIKGEEVNVGSIPFNQLDESNCDWAFSSDQYRAITTRYDTAKAALKAAETETSKARNVAAEEQHACLCRTQRHHRRLSKEHARNKELWSLAHGVMCMLDATTLCEVPDHPMLKIPVYDVECSHVSSDLLLGWRDFARSKQATENALATKEDVGEDDQDGPVASSDESELLVASDTEETSASNAEIWTNRDKLLSFMDKARAEKQALESRDRPFESSEETSIWKQEAGDDESSAEVEDIWKQEFQPKKKIQTAYQ